MGRAHASWQRPVTGSHSQHRPAPRPPGEAARAYCFTGRLREADWAQCTALMQKALSAPILQKLGHPDCGQSPNTAARWTVHCVGEGDAGAQPESRPRCSLCSPTHLQASQLARPPQGPHHASQSRIGIHGQPELIDLNADLPLRAPPPSGLPPGPTLRAIPAPRTLRSLPARPPPALCNNERRVQRRASPAQTRGTVTVDPRVPLISGL